MWARFAQSTLVALGLLGMSGCDGSPELPLRPEDAGRTYCNEREYKVVKHAFKQPGHYVVRVERTNKRGEPGVAKLEVRVGQK